MSDENRKTNKRKHPVICGKYASEDELDLNQLFRMEEQIIYEEPSSTSIDDMITLTPVKHIVQQTVQADVEIPADKDTSHICQCMCSRCSQKMDNILEEVVSLRMMLRMMTLIVGA